MTRHILNFNFFAFLISMAVLIHARDSPSGVPTTYTCPPQDNGGFPLGESDVTTNPIFCSYPAVPGENPNDFFCTYSMTTGVLVQDHDAGLCPTNAVPVAGMNKNRYKAHAPLPTRPQNVVRGIPDGAADKAYLKKSKRHATPKIAI
ncbi:hypothetical protein BJ912DRAFT_906639 [Pholiota molesta]|nr:hypothetical protein BJ912DRAFT_906639 [Pholiota molesta]